MLTEERKAELIQASLDWCNSIRARDGQEPLSELPKGAPSNPETCPCGQACSMNVYTRVAIPRASNPEGFTDAFHKHPDAEELPLWVRDFIHYFDLGLIPELVDRGS